MLRKVLLMLVATATQMVATTTSVTNPLFPVMLSGFDGFGRQTEVSSGFVFYSVFFYSVSQI